MDHHASSHDVAWCDLCKKDMVKVVCEKCITKLCMFCAGNHHISYEDHKLVTSESTLIYHRLGTFESTPIYHRKGTFEYTPIYHRHGTFESTPIYPECASHEKELCEMYCKNCKLPVSGVQNRIDQLEKEYEDLSTAMTIHKDNLHKKIDEHFNKSKAEVKKMKNRQMQSLQNHFEEINEKISEINDEIGVIDKAVDANDISKIFEVSFDADQQKKLLPKIVASVPKFNQGKIQEELFSKLFGTLSPFNLTSEKHGYRMKEIEGPTEGRSVSSPAAGALPKVNNQQILDQFLKSY
ncbi:uncharacterized protein LOC133175579 [Saccostrea echinata]|uniref:uncharacterized protein LOC133175579 n=1 Tax=Saccostrea echinata TaxID=191078 RepID=UPI002A808BBC|nr:uncharacterized protein LOC133175579 [Saccostrea echinata]